MITREEAIQLVVTHINKSDPQWTDKPEMIVTKVEDHELGWCIAYTSRPYHETHDFRFAIAGNAPFLVSSEDGTLVPTGTAPPFKERLREAESKLRSHLAKLTKK